LWQGDGPVSVAFPKITNHYKIIDNAADLNFYLNKIPISNY